MISTNFTGLQYLQNGKLQLSPTELESRGVWKGTFEALSSDLISSCIQIGEAVLCEREQGAKQHRDGGQRLHLQLLHGRAVQQVSLSPNSYLPVHEAYNFYFHF